MVLGAVFDSFVLSFPDIVWRWRLEPNPNRLQFWKKFRYRLEPIQNINPNHQILEISGCACWLFLWPSESRRGLNS